MRGASRSRLGTRSARGAGVLASLLAASCGRVGYVPTDAPATDLDAHLDAPMLDAPMLDSPMQDVPMLDAPMMDAPMLDAPIDAGPDAGLDAGMHTPIVPVECMRAPLPDLGAELPTAPLPEVPRETRIVSAPDTASLRTALATALEGDVIELEPGVSYRSEYVVTTSSITIRTRGVETAVASRVTPADAPLLARLVTGGSLSGLSIEASKVRVVGLELATDALSAPSIVRTAVGTSNIVLDRLYVHGSASHDVRAGIEINGPSTAVLRSDVREIHAIDAPRPAILVYTSGGPITILDNRLEASGEGVVLGTESALDAASVPHDVAICGNHLTRPLTWYPMDASYAGTAWPVGPLLGLYLGQRVLAAGNVIERAWPSAGGGGARGIALGPGNFAPAGAATVADVVLAWNHVRDVPEGMSFYAGDAGTLPLARVVVSQSLFEPLVSGRFGAGTGRILQVLDGAAGAVSGLVIEHVTAPGAVQNGIVTESVLSIDRLEVRDSILALGDFGLAGGGIAGVAGLGGLHHLGLIGASLADYGVSSVRVSALSDAGFADPAMADWRVMAVSPFAAISTTGGPAGCDVDRLASVLAGVAP